MSNCPNCGAPIQGEKCEYCGTILYDFSCIDIASPCFVKIKHNGLVLVSKMYVGDLSVTPHTSEIVCRDLSGGVTVLTDNNIEIDMTLVSINGYDVIRDGTL